MKIDPGSVKKIIIARTDRIGDVILTLPLVSEARRIFPKAKIYFLVSSYVKDLLNGYEDIDELLFIQDYPGFSGKRRLFGKIKPDMFIQAYPRAGLSIAAYLSGVKYRIGTAYRWYSIFLNLKVYEHRKECKLNEADYNLNLLKSFVDGAGSDKVYKLSYTENERKKFRDKFHQYELSFDDKYIIIHPGSGESSIDLPLEMFSEFAEKFIEGFKDYKVIITGTKRERNLYEKMHNSLPLVYRRSLYNLTGSLNLEELMILIDHTKLFMSNSTGPLHIAGALNKNTIGFYPNSKPVNAVRWGPPGKNSYVFAPPDGSDEMNKIDLNEVIDTTKRILINDSN